MCSILTKCLLSVPIALLLAGCHRGTVTVVESDPPRRVVVEERRSEPDVTVVVNVEEDEASYVVYREYYDCSDEEIAFIPYYRRYYFLDDCDLFFLFHVARHTRRHIDVVIRSYYYDCGRDYDRLIVSYRMDRAIFFVSLPGTYRPAGPFDRPYRLYREHSIASARFTNVEFRALVTLKIGVEYSGARPEVIVDRVREQPAAPHRVILRSTESFGAGGRNVQGQKITVQAPRPWKMPEKERQAFRQEREQKAVVREKDFEQKHSERVKEVRKVDDKPGQREKTPKDVEREKAPKDPKDVEREKAPRDPKDVEREKAPRDPKDVEREKAPRDPKDVEREKQREREEQLEREKELERLKELERQKDHDREKSPKDPKDPKKPK